MSFPGWETYLKGSKPCQFPRLGSPVKGSTAGLRQTSPARVGLKEADKLLLLSTTDTDTLTAVLLTAWALLLQRYTGQDDVSFSFQHRNGDVVARFLLDDSASVVGTVERAKTVLPGDLPPVPTRLIRPGDSGRPLFDTAVVLWNFTKNSAPCHVLAPVRSPFPSSPPPEGNWSTGWFTPDPTLTPPLLQKVDTRSVDRLIGLTQR